MRAIYLKQTTVLGRRRGRSFRSTSRRAARRASGSRESVFGQGSRRLATYWNQRYFEEGGFPPATLASQEAVIRFVAGNENAIGYVTQETVGDSVAVALIVAWCSPREYARHVVRSALSNVPALPLIDAQRDAQRRRESQF